MQVADAVKYVLKLLLLERMSLLLAFVSNRRCPFEVLVPLEQLLRERPCGAPSDGVQVLHLDGCSVGVILRRFAYKSVVLYILHGLWSRVGLSGLLRKLPAL